TAGPGTPTGAWVGAGVGGAAVLLVLLLPLLYRARVRARRLGSGVHLGRGTAAPAQAAWRELIDTAWDLGIPPDEAQTPRRAAERIVRLGELDEEGAAAVHRLAGAVERALYAPGPAEPSAGLVQDVRRARAALRASARRGARLRALLAPRSSVRAVWALSARWETLTTRLTPDRLVPASWRRH
ncbi:DUF4129 domain-containing protein, partial [Streptomyces montanisoli]